jgi:hypothetical protein
MNEMPLVSRTHSISKAKLSLIRRYWWERPQVRTLTRFTVGDVTRGSRAVGLHRPMSAQ